MSDRNAEPQRYKRVDKHQDAEVQNEHADFLFQLMVNTHTHLMHAVHLAHKWT